MISVLLLSLVVSQAPAGVAELHQALEEQASVPAAAAHYPRAEPRRPDAVDQVRELANEHAKNSTAALKKAEHGDNSPQGNAANAGASAQGQARANQVRKNPGKPPKPNGPH